MTEIPAGFRGAAQPLAAGDIERVAAALGVEARTINAVASVEATGHGFLPDGRPQLLFEAQQFSELTGGKYDASHPNISSSSWDKSLYGAGGAHQYDRLTEALSLDHEAALKSATWGMFQILGRNIGLVGFPDVESLVSAMCESEGRQLDAFAKFCAAKNLARFLASHDWVNFALGYDGPDEIRNAYAARLMVAYAEGRLPAPPAPPLPPSPPHPGPVKAIVLQPGEEATFPLAGLDQAGEPFLPLPADALAPADPHVCGATVAAGIATITYAGPGQTAVRGTGFEADITCEASRLVRLVPDWSRLVIKRIPVTAPGIAAALLVGMLARPASPPAEPIGIQMAGSPPAISDFERRYGRPNFYLAPGPLGLVAVKR